MAWASTAVQGFHRGGLGFRSGGLGLQARGALNEDQRMGAGEIGGQGGEAGCHAHDITMLRPPLPSLESHPTAVGRQVARGWRQSIPDKR